MFLVAVAGLLLAPGVASAKDDAAKPDWPRLRGEWVTPAVTSADGSTQTRHRLIFSSTQFGRSVAVWREVKGKGDLKFEGGPVHSRALVVDSLEKGAAENRMVLLPADGHPDSKFEVEYRISGHQLHLSGHIGGVKVTGDWTRQKSGR
jgi:hypothetical protein